jgi:tetratricopeptide (TPR) repeat protein
MSAVASIQAAGGESALSRGAFADARNQFLDARQIWEAPIYGLRLSDAYRQLAARSDDPVRDLTLAHQVAKETLDWNVVNQGSWGRMADASRQLVAHQPEFSEQAVHEAQVMVQMMPGFWQSRALLALTYINVHESEPALATASALITEGQGVRSAGEMAFLLYVRALAFEQLERYDEALADAQEALVQEPGFRDVQPVIDRLLPLVEATG